MACSLGDDGQTEAFSALSLRLAKAAELPAYCGNTTSERFSYHGGILTWLVNRLML